ncbi:shikimate kinase [Pectobacterium aroidearum]|uniref:shikimate kinase n=1 Tax=Pectobacterium aroidearum TaxID=1201031 RepID=UPI0015DF1AFB|nr:shikimate kinase [Pectobacterium aroidearum]MBA0203577.1 adenylate kinase [Pectobacterium aroidearum]MBA5236908.1 adenylate kinase [Pectobacterium aroidearum]UUE59209.1 adenylate kinase [Pectobacterium aroidearum]UUE72036.1 adenylate kinase [Pectobacterium aroidearum]UUE76435.1 adenylate kinase [Pectobacterium aroidearum]
MRVNIIGTSGSGKSTLARRLSEKLAIPYIEMDALFWLKDWQERTDTDFFQRLESALEPESWVLDGNYNRTRDIKWRNVDVVVWVDYGFTRTLFQAIRRACARAWHKEELWIGTGNKESFLRSFFSRKSIILWTIKTYSRNRKRYLADLADPRYQHIHFITLRSPRECETFLQHFPEEIRLHSV